MVILGPLTYMGGYWQAAMEAGQAGGQLVEAGAFAAVGQLTDIGEEGREARGHRTLRGESRRAHNAAPPSIRLRRMPVRGRSGRFPSSRRSRSAPSHLRLRSLPLTAQSRKRAA